MTTTQIRTSILRRPEVEAATGLRRSTLYALIAEGRFPTPIPLGARAVGWLENEVEEWVNARIAERDAALPSALSSFNRESAK